MLVVYFDDSGSNKEGPVMVLAGFGAKATSWMRFSDEWQSALRENPCLAYFKIKEALRLEGQFGRYNPIQRDKRVFKLCSLIRKYAVFGVVGSFKWGDFHKAQAQFPKGTFRPYQCLFFGLMSAVVQDLLRTQTDAEIHFVFDQQGAAGHLAVKVFDAIRERLSPKEQRAVLGISHVDDKLVLPLQAADCLAWLMRRYAFEHRNSAPDLGDWKPDRACLEPLRSIPRLHTYYPLERFAKLIERYKAGSIA